jgi:uncharacterized protein YndB with AHSA1/START domain
VRSTDFVTVTTVVALAPDATFAVFTDEVDAWWRRGPRFRFREDGEGKLAFSEGRLVESYADGERFEVGRVLTWEPGTRLVFEWRDRNFAPGEITEVEVRFEPDRRGTRVTLVHRGWDRLRPDHPARRGSRGGVFVDVLGLWWADQTVSLRAWASRH